MEIGHDHHKKQKHLEHAIYFFIALGLLLSGGFAIMGVAAMDTINGADNTTLNWTISVVETDNTSMKNCTISGSNPNVTYSKTNFTLVNEVKVIASFPPSPVGNYSVATLVICKTGTGTVGVDTGNEITTYIHINPREPPCTPNWVCGSWGTCTGSQTRVCNDTNKCGKNDGKPATIQSCITPPINNTTNTTTNTTTTQTNNNQQQQNNQQNTPQNNTQPATPPKEEPETPAPITEQIVNEPFVPPAQESGLSGMATAGNIDYIPYIALFGIICAVLFGLFKWINHEGNEGETASTTYIQVDKNGEITD